MRRSTAPASVTDGVTTHSGEAGYLVFLKVARAGRFGAFAPVSCYVGECTAVRFPPPPPSNFIDCDGLARVESWRGTSKSFNHLHKSKQAIEASFGEPLEWEALDGKRACRIRKTVAVAGWRDEENWPAAQDQMIDAMIRLERALRPHLRGL